MLSDLFLYVRDLNHDEGMRTTTKNTTKSRRGASMKAFRLLGIFQASKNERSLRGQMRRRQDTIPAHDPPNHLSLLRQQTGITEMMSYKQIEHRC